MQNLSEQLLEATRRLAQQGLNKGTSGNVSVRLNVHGEHGFLVTPSGIPVNEMLPSSMVKMQFDGSFEQGKKPSSEWRFHRDILQSRADINAVVHTHSQFATTMACLHQHIPPFHYMIAVTGSDTVLCAPYALFGSQALSDAALLALKNSKACLLANHGMIALGKDLEEALSVAIEVENLCEQYWRILQVNPTPPLLSETQMRDVFQQFKGYGKWVV